MRRHIAPNTDQALMTATPTFNSVNLYRYQTATVSALHHGAPGLGGVAANTDTHTGHGHRHIAQRHSCVW